jgi:hypothetical protein
MKLFINHDISVPHIEVYAAATAAVKILKNFSAAAVEKPKAGTAAAAAASRPKELPSNLGNSINKCSFLVDQVQNGTKILLFCDIIKRMYN